MSSSSRRCRSAQISIQVSKRNSNLIRTLCEDRKADLHYTQDWGLAAPLALRARRRRARTIVTAEAAVNATMI